jgi:hypothetical protein
MVMTPADDASGVIENFPASPALLRVFCPLPQPEKTGMTTADIAARVRRLNRLARGLALELHNVGKADDPMLSTERQQYLTAMRSVLQGAEGAGLYTRKRGSGSII